MDAAAEPQLCVAGHALRPCRCRPHGRDRYLHDRRYDAL